VLGSWRDRARELRFADRVYGRALQALLVASYRRARSLPARGHLALEYQLMVGRARGSLSEAREALLLARMGDLWWCMTDAEQDAANIRAAFHVAKAGLVDHADFELKRAKLFDKDSDYEGMIGKAVMELVTLFAKQGHSGFSAMLALDVFDKVAKFKPLTPITSNPEEWFDVRENIGGDEALWQNKRDPALFSNDGGKTWYDIDKPEKKMKAGEEKVDRANPPRFITLDELREAGRRAREKKNKPVYDPGFDGFIGVMDPDIKQKRRRTRERQEKMKRKEFVNIASLTLREKGKKKLADAVQKILGGKPQQKKKPKKKPPQKPAKKTLASRVKALEAPAKPKKKKKD
jgi:hypothetical protein